MARPPVPVALERDPIVAAIFEVRFQSQLDGIADVLPGLLFASMLGTFDKVVPLPASEIPKAVRQQMPDPQYQGLKRLVGKGCNVNIGERSVVVELPRPYWGWETFRTLIHKVLKSLADTALIGGVDRISLRYTNLLEPDDRDLTRLNLTVALANFQIKQNGFQLRAEIDSGFDTFSIINISNSAVVQFQPSENSSGQISGILLDVDCIKTASLKDFWSKYPELIDDVHKAEKEVFFGLLQQRTLDALSPKWGTS